MRPCIEQHLEPASTAAACRLCWLTLWHPDYRAAWGDPDAAPPPPPAEDGDDDGRIHAGMCVRCLVRRLDEPRDGWPPDWPHWPVTAHAHRLAFAAVVAAAAPPLAWLEPRGIVVCSGGWRFFSGLYVMIRVLRQVGCALPVEVWYLGTPEFDPRMAAALKPYGSVFWRDAHALCRERGLARRRLGGWELKAFAVYHSRFREVLSLDADCYPAFDPTALFDHPAYRAAGAVFWPDNPNDPHGRLEPGQWERWGVPYRDEPSFESGQFLVDRARCGRALAACDWMNDHSDYTYVHQYGDKDTFHLAWRATATPFVLAPPVRWHDVAFLQHDLEGGVLFVHRCRDKWRLGEQAYCTAQRGPANVWSHGLPHEAFCHAALADLDRLLNPEREFALRPGTWDKDIWHHVTLLDEYRLPERFAADEAILDVGGHVGSFSHAVLSRGAGVVHVVEPDPENLALLRANLARHGPRAVVHAGAAWRSDMRYPLELPLDSPPEWANTGARACGLSTVKEGAGQTIRVAALCFDDLVRAATDGGARRLRLLKIDCEGSEFPILYTSRMLHCIDEICGEYHAIASIPAHARVAGHPSFTAAALATYLEAAGFSVELVAVTPKAGLFFARRS